MKKVELRFQHGRLLFGVGDEEYFISSDDLMSLLDGQKVKQTFQELDPAVIFADWDNFDFIARFEALKEKGFAIDEIAEREGTTKERLETWLTERADVIQAIKDIKPSNFQAAVRGAKERIPNKKE